MPSRSAASPRWSPASRSRPGRTGSPSTPPAACRVLPQAYDDLRFAFYGRTLSGQQQQRPRERRAIQATSNALIDAVGKIYVERHFPASAKAEVDAMVRNIVQAFDRRLQGLDWMAPATLAEARRKVETVIVGIGYPDHWRDYSALEIRRRRRLRQCLARAGVRISPPARQDRPAGGARRMVAGAQTVNAVYLPLQNAMNFPAGILEPPFYDRTADAAYQLRRDRLGDRPRDQPQLRQSRRRVRRMRGGCATGGRRRTSPISARPARRWSASTTPTSPSRASRSTAS